MPRVIPFSRQGHPSGGQRKFMQMKVATFGGSIGTWSMHARASRSSDQYRYHPIGSSPGARLKAREENTRREWVTTEMVSPTRSPMACLI